MKDSIKCSEKLVTVLLVLTTLVMMVTSQLIGEPSHYVTFVAIPTVSVFFWMQHAKVKYSTHKRLWSILVGSLTAWSVFFTTFLFVQTVG